MHYGVSVGLAVTLGFLAMGSTEVAAQRKSKTQIVVKNYYISPNAMYYAAPPAAKSYVAPPVSYYSAPPAVYPAPTDLPASSPGYQGSWRNSRF
jgi:hypothetical protein